ncbi:hypothetical protein FTW19_09410 [Terriglobus albidus]|uniref:Uncharacterized protein n=1 Tax=Terriglobus albidus TaxID=1592106 RepID=A0A5B9E7F1_9BACT|nr:hypothetical protein FTW19_09410 [Terriglobus albidus]
MKQIRYQASSVLESDLSVQRGVFVGLGNPYEGISISSHLQDVAPSKFLVAIASDWRKPNGLFSPKGVDTFLFRFEL